MSLVTSRVLTYRDGGNKYVSGHYYVPDPALCVLHALFHLLLTTALQHAVIL